MSSRTLQTSGTGTHNGFYYSFWKDGGDATMTLGAGGKYSSKWTKSTNNWVGGKGWATGSKRTVSYSGTFKPEGNGYLALYGWTKNPLVEYYVVENFGTFNPGKSSKRVGSVTADGGTYDIYKSQQVNKPSIDGTKTFPQFWSVRQKKRSSGTITTAKHFEAWAKAGLKLGSSFNYQIMATEGYRSGGSSDITVRQGGSSDLGKRDNSEPDPCTAEIHAGEQHKDRFTLNVVVRNADSWVVSLALNGGQSLQSGWSAALGEAGGIVTAKPNGGGNSFGVTIMTDGNNTWPTVTCRMS